MTMMLLIRKGFNTFSCGRETEAVLNSNYWHHCQQNRESLPLCHVTVNCVVIAVSAHGTTSRMRGNSPQVLAGTVERLCFFSFISQFLPWHVYTDSFEGYHSAATLPRHKSHLRLQRPTPSNIIFTKAS